MPIVVTCPTCHRKARVPSSARGKTVKCPSCAASFTAETDPPPIPVRYPTAPEFMTEPETEPTTAPVAAEAEDGRTTRGGVGLLAIAQGLLAVSLALQLLETLIQMAA